MVVSLDPEKRVEENESEETRPKWPRITRTSVYFSRS